jgi:hypothetical protein
MKKIIFLLSFICITFAVNAQSTSPRFGTNPKSQSNTGASLNYQFVAPTEVATYDTISINPAAFETVVRPTAAILDSVTFQVKTNKNSYAGDKLYFTFLGATGSTTKVKFTGTYFKSSGTLSMTTATRATIVFVFDGTYWCEVARTISL